MNAWSFGSRASIRASSDSVSAAGLSAPPRIRAPRSAMLSNASVAAMSMLLVELVRARSALVGWNLPAEHREDQPQSRAAARLVERAERPETARPAPGA